eukprot:767050-Hanusia_phi.AAC.2
MDRRSAINTHYMRLIFGACLAALVFSESFSVKLTSFHVGSVLRLRGARGNAYDGKEWLLHEWEEGDFDRSEEAPAEEVNKEREEISSMDSSDSDIIVNTTKVKSDEDMKNELAEALKGLSFNTSETGESFNYSETMYNFGISKEYLEKEVFTGAHKRERRNGHIIDEKERIKNGTYRAMAPIPGTAVPIISYAQPTGLWRPGMDPDDPKFASAGPVHLDAYRSTRLTGNHRLSADIQKLLHRGISAHVHASCSHLRPGSLLTTTNRGSPTRCTTTQRWHDSLLSLSLLPDVCASCGRMIRNPSLKGLCIMPRTQSKETCSRDSQMSIGDGNRADL